MTLLLLVVAAMALAGVCRRSMARAAGAIEAERDLQRRWAMISCQRTLLPRAELILRQTEARTRRPESAVSARIELGAGRGRQAFTLLFADEQAKINLNRAFAADRAAVAGVVARFVFGSALRVELRPSPGAAVGERDGALADSPTPPRAFESFGQIFDTPSPVALITGTGELTCWGDGRLNVQRASREALLTALHDTLGRAGVDRLMAVRQATPGFTLSVVLDELDVPQRDRDQLASKLVQGSTCHSLWIVPDSTYGSTATLGVSEIREGAGLVHHFGW